MLDWPKVYPGGYDSPIYAMEKPFDPALLAMTKSSKPNDGPSPLSRLIAASPFPSFSGSLKGARSSLLRRENKNDP